MTINTEKTKVVIMKSKKVTYTNLVYDSSNLVEMSSYKYLKIDIHTSSTRILALRRGLMEGGKLILVKKTIVNQQLVM